MGAQVDQTMRLVDETHLALGVISGGESRA